MKCPRTGRPLKTIKVGRIAVDVSEECGGVFFDHSELEQFDQPHEVRGEVLVDHLAQFEAVILAADHRLHCPKCEIVVMIRRFYPYSKPHSLKHHSSKHVSSKHESSKHQGAMRIEIDECPHCRGIWLDGGELRRLQESFAAERKRVAICDQLTAEVLKIPEVRKQQFDDTNSIRRLQTVAEILYRLVLKRFDS
jgi:Zn-finger nucleic acid-binding protein